MGTCPKGFKKSKSRKGQCEKLAEVAKPAGSKRCVKPLRPSRTRKDKCIKIITVPEQPSVKNIKTGATFKPANFINNSDGLPFVPIVKPTPIIDLTGYESKPTRVKSANVKVKLEDAKIKSQPKPAPRPEQAIMGRSEGVQSAVPPVVKAQIIGDDLRSNLRTAIDNIQNQRIAELQAEIAAQQLLLQAAQRHIRQLEQDQQQQERAAAAEVQLRQRLNALNVRYDNDDFMLIKSELDAARNRINELTAQNANAEANMQAALQRVNDVNNQRNIDIAELQQARANLRTANESLERQREIHARTITEFRNRLQNIQRNINSVQTTERTARVEPQPESPAAPAGPADVAVAAAVGPAPTASLAPSAPSAPALLVSPEPPALPAPLAILPPPEPAEPGIIQRLLNLARTGAGSTNVIASGAAMRAPAALIRSIISSQPDVGAVQALPEGAVPRLPEPVLVPEPPPLALLPPPQPPAPPPAPPAPPAPPVRSSTVTAKLPSPQRTNTELWEYIRGQNAWKNFCFAQNKQDRTYATVKRDGISASSNCYLDLWYLFMYVAVSKGFVAKPNSIPNTDKMREGSFMMEWYKNYADEYRNLLLSIALNVERMNSLTRFG